MARPRRVTGSAHVAVDGPIVPPISRDDWQALVSIVGVKLRAKSRSAIFSACDAYTVEKLLESDGARRARLLTGRGGPSINELERSLSAALHVWQIADADDTAAIALIEVGTKANVESTYLRLRLELFLTALRQWRERAVEDVRKPLPAFERLVTDVAAVLDREGTTITAHGRGYEGASPSPFADFVWELNGFLRPEVRRPTNSRPAFEAAVSKALRSR